jgi:hypothetical protein
MLGLNETKRRLFLGASAILFVLVDDIISCLIEFYEKHNREEND